jgi:spermidine/putrescine transport system ATP-binding protein
MIAGFETPDLGRIWIQGTDVTDVHPRKRPVNMVFQSYGLFPHMSVAENVAFGLRIKKLPREEIAGRVTEVIRTVRLEGMEDRRPAQLSGGQQQRVALARALVNHPAALLLDEPLGALDAKLRKRLQIELKALQEEVGITFIYVTHDQEEALTMSDRIAVMSQGRVEQVGGPKEIYEEPATAYVADFLGVSNLMDAKASGATAGGCKVALGEFDLVAGQGVEDTVGDAKVTIRPERVAIQAQGTTGENRVPAMVERVVYVGSILQVMVHLASGSSIQAWIQNEGGELPFASGAPITVHLPREALRVLPDVGTAPVISGELED